MVTVCKLLEALLLGKTGPDLNQDPVKLNPLIGTTFVFCFLWGIGGNLCDSYWDAFDTFLRQEFEDSSVVKVSASYF